MKNQKQICFALRRSLPFPRSDIALAIEYRKLLPGLGSNPVRQHIVTFAFCRPLI